ncbi:hypothetical protein C4J81_11750 [Deltaproteobacteria bacterium Smac51]|nr:hypothetical protein C4J81_11750 [Deltaproteobacteria bacterium Smac51]
MLKYKHLKKRLIATCVGIVFCAFGISLCLKGNVGLDPFGAFNKGMGALVGLSLGNFQLLINFILIAVIAYFKRSLIGAGTLINMFLVGYLIDLFSWLHSQVFSFPPGLWNSAIHLFLGLTFLTFGLSLYIMANLGVGPYDAISLVIVERVPIPFRICRIIQDSTAMILAWLLGAPIGIATILMAFSIGPLVTFWNRRVTRYILDVPQEALR